MAKPADDLAAVRAVVDSLRPFEPSDQERIIRWAREKLGLASSSELNVEPSGRLEIAPPVSQPATGRPAGRDLKTFVTEKNPKTDAQFAATVAYYYQFEAPPEKKKTPITAEDLQEACRLVDRDRLKHPGQTLRNAFQSGLFDRNKTGNFTLNSVGENLVAMTLPGGGEAKSPRKSPGRRAKAKKRKDRK